MPRRFAIFLWWTLLIAVATFPWIGFTTHSHWPRVAWIPLASGIVRPIDLVLNLALYAPWGYQFPGRDRASRIAAAMACAFVLSSALEITQVWSHTRYPSATDVLMNVAGAGLGAWLTYRKSHVARSAS